MISRSDFESIVESASSLDYNPRSQVQGGIFAGGGDPYLRISKDTESEILRAEEESEGPDADLKKKIDEWRAHAQDFKTGAGFRKASRGQVDPRRFALHLSRIAFRHAQQYGSKSLLKISKRLKWAASQSRQAAEQELQKISNENDDPEEYQVGRSRIEKPVVAPPAPQWGPQRTTPGAVPGVVPSPVPGATPETTPVRPGSMREEMPDHSWSAEKTGSRRRAREKSNDDLVGYALEYLASYRSDNSLGDNEELLSRLEEDDVFNGWVKDLDKRHVLADPEDMNEAWNQAIEETTGNSTEIDEGLSSGITTSSKTPDPRIQPFMAPGGDWANTVVRTEDDPLKARYIERQMHSHRRANNWANNFIADDYQSGMDHFLRRTSSKSDEEKEIIKIANQFLDGAAGALTPDQIAPEDVEEFVKGEYPDADHKKVYAVIAEITDPKKRHEKDKKERTNEEYRASRPVQTMHRRPKVVSSHYVSAFDTIDSTPQRRHAHLQGHREICACCTGTGQEGAGACSRCQGKGRHGLDPDDSQIAAKARVIEKVGSLLLVEINPQQLAPKGRQALSQVTHTRVASGNRVRYTHSPELMRFLTSYDVPFKMVGYTHPNYQVARNRSAGFSDLFGGKVKPVPSMTPMARWIGYAYERIETILYYCNFWLTRDSDCQVVLNDLNHGLYRDCARLIHSISSGANSVDEKANPEFADIIDKLEGWWFAIEKLYAFCKDREGKDDTSLTAYIRNLQKLSKEIEKGRGKFEKKYKEGFY